MEAALTSGLSNSSTTFQDIGETVHWESTVDGFVCACVTVVCDVSWQNSAIARLSGEVMAVW